MDSYSCENDKVYVGGDAVRSSTETVRDRTVVTGGAPASGVIRRLGPAARSLEAIEMTERRR
jgi:hypothetical protein